MNKAIIYNTKIIIELFPWFSYYPRRTRYCSDCSLDSLYWELYAGANLERLRDVMLEFDPKMSGNQKKIPNLRTQLLRKCLLVTCPGESKV